MYVRNFLIKHVPEINVLDEFWI